MRPIARSPPASARPKATSTSGAAWSRPSRAALAYAPYADLLWCETSHAGPGRSAEVRRGDAREVPGQDARLQLLAVVQLEAEARREDDREVPARARRDGLQVPVHHAGRLAPDQLLHVRPGAAYSDRGHAGVRRAAAARSSRARRMATPPRSTSAKRAPATSTRC